MQACCDDYLDLGRYNAGNWDLALTRFKAWFI